MHNVVAVHNVAMATHIEHSVQPCYLLHTEHHALAVVNHCCHIKNSMLVTLRI